MPKFKKQSHETPRDKVARSRRERHHAPIVKTPERFTGYLCRCGKEANFVRHCKFPIFVSKVSRFGAYGYDAWQDDMSRSAYYGVDSRDLPKTHDDGKQQLCGNCLEDMMSTRYTAFNQICCRIEYLYTPRVGDELSIGIECALRVWE